jgi:hypothetical protein
MRVCCTANHCTVLYNRCIFCHGQRVSKRDPEWLQQASVPAPAEGLAMQPQCVWLSDRHLETDFARPIHKAWPSRRNACRAVVCSLPWTGRLLLTRPHCRIQCKYTVDGRPVRGRCRKPSQHVLRGRSRSRGTRDEGRGTRNNVVALSMEHSLDFPLGKSNATAKTSRDGDKHPDPDPDPDLHYSVPSTPYARGPP